MKHDRFAYIDALRGWAILGVIVTHAGSLTKLGGVPGRVVEFGGRGVQLFFIVSAFTIFLTYKRALERETFPTKNFFTRRLMRIVPMYWLGIVLYTAVYGLASRGWKDGPELWHYPLHLTLTNVLVPSATSSVVPGGWSISVEVLFYLTTPLWFWVVKSLRDAMAFTAASLVFGAIFISTGADAVPGIDQYWFRSFPSQLPCFGFGMILYYWVQSNPNGLTTQSANLGLLMAAVAMALIGFTNALPIVPSHYWTTGGFLLLAMSLVATPSVLIVNRLTVWVGQISFSAYLLHFLVLKQIDLAMHDSITGYGRFAVVTAVGIMVTLPVAWLSYRYAETAFSNLGKRWISQRESQSRRFGVVDLNAGRRN
ncbi:peptidoglycan/LPS O-acetylase OafA/YrhL [Novosphingobium chloroacetimidivorans]|uniref:Peptidoglycan/LPS O-acetylase OafA/YrhL n=1 Tax=Novosphingobium chloroacetimidivorans TaxID=1428314 RepID=A0A7W7KB87_9SPHN|nr:acyltransferase [Novosphingobium chloroacetimidivorans]MBB4859615.1 peptidoglycan/LPS O-acetylase OafA/YrhL [Novosphingobium chloroacetimidivorans]